MTKGDKCRIYHGPLSGMTAELVRHDNANRAWYAMVNGEKMLVYDFELVEVIKRPERKTIKDASEKRAKNKHRLPKQPQNEAI